MNNRGGASWMDGWIYSALFLHFGGEDTTKKTTTRGEEEREIFNKVF